MSTTQAVVAYIAISAMSLVSNTISIQYTAPTPRAKVFAATITAKTLLTAKAFAARTPE